MKKRVELISLVLSIIALLGLVVKYIKEKRKEGLDEIYSPEDSEKE